jgi:putative redox protein
VWFEGSAGDQLNARLDTPDGRPTAYVLFAHCFTCSKEIAAATRIARGLVDQGMGVLRFDFTGLGESEGEFANTNFSSNVDDLVLAADMLRDRYEPPALLVGHSLGGAAVLAAAARVPEAVGVVTIGAPFDPRQLTSLIPPEALSRLDRNGDIVIEIGGRPFPIRRQLLDDVNAQNLTAAIEGLKRALLVFHAPRDELVEIDNARRIFDVARHPKSFVSLDDADHLLTRPGDAAYVAEVLGAWASRYCTRQAPGNGRATPEGTVVVVDAPKGPVAETIRAGRHTLLADEPAEVGDDTGPTPYDLLLASLGACTAMTVRLYAARKGWPLEHTSLSLRHDRVHAADSVDCDAPRGMIDRIDVDLDLDGPLTDDQRQRLLDIAERCPVHRTLLGEKRITVRLAQDPELVPMSPDRIGGRSIMRSNDDRPRPNGGRS